MSERSSTVIIYTVTHCQPKLQSLKRNFKKLMYLTLVTSKPLPEDRWVPLVRLSLLPQVHGIFDKPTCTLYFEISTADWASSVQKKASRWKLFEWNCIASELIGSCKLSSLILWRNRGQRLLSSTFFSPRATATLERTVQPCLSPELQDVSVTSFSKLRILRMGESVDSYSAGNHLPLLRPKVKTWS